MRVVALDIGERRVGVAAGDTSSRVAVPLKVLPAADVEQCAPAFRRLVEDHEPELIVAGVPLTLSGERGPQAERVERVARAVSERLGLPLAFSDERLSSAEAKRVLREQGMSERQMRGRLDCVAASLFLQSWLDAQAASAASTTMGDS